MTTTDMDFDTDPTDPRDPRRPDAVRDAGGGPRLLRRSASDRFGAGVAGGLGEYFGIDPVLFRVLFATAAFFGGAGIVAYLLLWAVVPEDGTPSAPIDGWIRQLRRHRVPPWLVAVVAGVALWVGAFSWWAPGRFVPVVLVVALLVLALGRRSGGGAPDPSAEPVPPTMAAPPDGVSLTKQPRLGGASAAYPAHPAPLEQARRWRTEARAAARLRRRRAFPVAAGTWLLLLTVFAVLALIDAVHGVRFDAYAWTALGVLAAGLVLGVALRRTPLSLIAPLLLSVLVVLATGGTRASLHDGIGQRSWTPQAASDATYRLGFGDATLDLTHLAKSATPVELHVDVVAGRVTVIVPKHRAVTVAAALRAGAITVDGETPDNGENGWQPSRTVTPPRGATGGAVKVDVSLSDGLVHVVRR